MTPTPNNIALGLNRLNQLITRNNDMTGRRCINAGNAVNLQDYVTLSDLNNAIDGLSTTTFTTTITNNNSTSVTLRGMPVTY